MRQKKTKCANFRGNPLFQSYVQHTQKNPLIFCQLDACGRKRAWNLPQSHSLFPPQASNWQKIKRIVCFWLTSVLCPLPSTSIKLAKDKGGVCFCAVSCFEKEDYLENSCILSCFVRIKGILFNLLCVFDLFTQGSADVTEVEQKLENSKQPPVQAVSLILNIMKCGNLFFVCSYFLWDRAFSCTCKQPLIIFNPEGRWGTTDDFTITFLNFSLFSTALWV